MIMGKISSLPDDVRHEIIGYLAQPGIIANITAEVPVKKCAEFEEKYGVTPYPVNSEHKYGDQYRIYLSDPDGCPDILKNALDLNYGRLNDTVFIRELVDEYGFSFFQATQDSRAIQERAKAASGESYTSFLKGFNTSSEFLTSLKSSVGNGDSVTPDIQLIKETDTPSGTSGKKSRRHSLIVDSNAGLSETQLLQLGWIGEQYFYKTLLENKNNILSLFGVNDKENCTITWFNNGFDSTENWSDKSVGKGCDILIQEGSRNIFVEVKTSKRKSPIFAMTSFEIQTMQQKKDDFFVVKIDNIEHLVTGKVPNVRVFASPFEYFFVPSRMYSAVFYCN